jgi:hypothetical protein
VLTTKLAVEHTGHRMRSLSSSGGLVILRTWRCGMSTSAPPGANHCNSSQSAGAHAVGNDCQLVVPLTVNSSGWSVSLAEMVGQIRPSTPSQALTARARAGSSNSRRHRVRPSRYIRLRSRLAMR